MTDGWSLGTVVLSIGTALLSFLVLEWLLAGETTTRRTRKIRGADGDEEAP